MEKKYNINDLAPLYYQENKQNRSFDIHNQRSHVNTFYQINAPFQVTYEFCSGTNDDDY